MPHGFPLPPSGGQQESICAETIVQDQIALLEDPEWKIRKSAAIGAVSQPAIPTLLEALNDAEWHVRKSAVLALTAIAPENPDVLAALQASLDDPEDQVRRAAARALEVIEALTIYSTMSGNRAYTLTREEASHECHWGNSSQHNEHDGKFYESDEQTAQEECQHVSDP